jgi:AcrR family transcriptional regulator
MSSLSGRPIRADARRNEAHILDCTAELIAVNPSATLEQIAMRAGVSRVTLHARFRSRNALMDALTDRSVTEVTAALAAARPEEGPAGEALERVLVAAWETIGRYRGLVIVNQRLDPAVLRARLGPAIAPLLPLIRRGQQAGEFDPELPVQWLLTVMLDLIHAASRQVSTGAMNPHAAQTALLRTAAAALSAHPAR